MTPLEIPEDWLDPFEASPYRLRFELGGDRFGMDAPVPRFVQAFGRARQIVQDLFEAAPRVMGVTRVWDNPSNDLFAPAEDGFQALADAGFRAAPEQEWRTEDADWEDEDFRTFTTWRAYDVTGHVANRDVLIWCAISYEMPVQPKTPVKSYLVDFERGMLVNVYDDRGMDVTALAPDALRPLYRERNAWLLDHDRPRMVEAFGDAGL